MIYISYRYHDLMAFVTQSMGMFNGMLANEKAGEVDRTSAAAAAREGGAQGARRLRRFR